jgi:hypothetical protein
LRNLRKTISMRTYGSGFHPHEFRAGVPRSLRKTPVHESDRVYASLHTSLLLCQAAPFQLRAAPSLGLTPILTLRSTA